MALFRILGCLRESVFFAWEATWVRILTLDQLKRRGWRIPNRCYLCKEEEETSDHILIHCSKACFCGSWYLCFLVFSGWCILQVERFFWVGMGPLLVKRGRRLGRLLRCFYFGLCGRRGIGELLITNFFFLIRNEGKFYW